MNIEKRTCDRQETRKPAKPFLIGCVKVRILQEAPKQTWGIDPSFFDVRLTYRLSALKARLPLASTAEKAERQESKILRNGAKAEE